MTHELKIESKYFEAVKDGRKTFEIRNNDRDFHVGDTVRLNEIEYQVGYSEPQESGDWIELKITYVSNYEQKDGYVVWGFEKI